MSKQPSFSQKTNQNQLALADFNLEAEVISSLALRLGEEEGLALPSLSERDFVFPETRALFRLVKRMVKFGEPVDGETLTTRALGEGLEKSRVLAILASSPDPYQLPRQVERLKTLTRKRKIHELTQKLATGKLSENYFFQAMERYRKISTNQESNKEKLTSLIHAPEIDERAQIDFVVPELIPRSYLTWLVGYPKVGKSWLSLRLACDVSVGGSILDGVSYTPAPQRVLYILGDTGPAQPMSRLKRTRWRYDSENLRFVYLSELTERGLDLDFGKPEGRNTLEAIIKLTSPDLVVLDSFSSLVSSDLNKEVEAKPLALCLNQLSQKFNIGLLVLYHTRKPPKNLEGAKLTQHDISGSGSLTRFSGVTIGVEEREDRKTNEKNHLVRYLGGWVREFPAFSFRLVDDVDGQTDEEIVRMEIDRNPEKRNLRETVLEAIKSQLRGRWFTREELTEAVPSVSEEWLRRILRELVSRGELQKRGSTRDTQYFFPSHYTQQYPNKAQIGLNTAFDLGSGIPKSIPKSTIGIPKSIPKSSATIPKLGSNALEKPIPACTTENRMASQFHPNLGIPKKNNTQIQTRMASGFQADLGIPVCNASDSSSHDYPNIGEETKNHFSPYIPKRNKKFSGIL